MPRFLKSLPASAREQARALAAYGLSQSEIAARFGVSRQTVSRWMKDDVESSGEQPDGLSSAASDTNPPFSSE